MRNLSERSISSTVDIKVPFLFAKGSILKLGVLNKLLQQIPSAKDLSFTSFSGAGVLSQSDRRHEEINI